MSKEPLRDMIHKAAKKFGVEYIKSAVRSVVLVADIPDRNGDIYQRDTLKLMARDVEWLDFDEKTGILYSEIEIDPETELEKEMKK